MKVVRRIIHQRMKVVRRIMIIQRMKSDCGEKSDLEDDDLKCNEDDFEHIEKFDIMNLD